MIKQFHDQVRILAQFSEVRARFELFGVATDELAHFRSQIAHLKFLARIKAFH